MKTVTYRGGVITFRIPESWIEEHGREGGGAYYADIPGSGTLRLNVISTEPPEPFQPRHLLEAVAAAGEGASPPELLSNGNALRSYWQGVSADGRDGRVRWWALAGGAPPTTVRLALFSFEPGEDAQGNVLDMLDTEIRHAQFTSLTSEEVAALASAAKKPWWRFW